MKRLLRTASSLAAIDNQTEAGVGAFHLACFSGDLKCVELLVRAGCDTELKNKTGVTGLDAAEHEGNDAVVKFLLRHAASLPPAVTAGGDDAKKEESPDIKLPEFAAKDVLRARLHMMGGVDNVDPEDMSTLRKLCEGLWVEAAGVDGRVHKIPLQVERLRAAIELYSNERAMDELMTWFLDPMTNEEYGLVRQYPNPDELKIKATHVQMLRLRLQGMGGVDCLDPDDEPYIARVLQHDKQPIHEKFLIATLEKRAADVALMHQERLKVSRKRAARLAEALTVLKAAGVDPPEPEPEVQRDELDTGRAPPPQDVATVSLIAGKDWIAKRELLDPSDPIPEEETSGKHSSMKKKKIITNAGGVGLEYGRNSAKEVPSLNAHPDKPLSEAVQGLGPMAALSSITNAGRWSEKTSLRRRDIFGLNMLESIDRSQVLDVLAALQPSGLIERFHDVAKYAPNERSKALKAHEYAIYFHWRDNFQPRGKALRRMATALNFLEGIHPTDTRLLQQLAEAEFWPTELLRAGVVYQQCERCEREFGPTSYDRDCRAQITRINAIIACVVDKPPGLTQEVDVDKLMQLREEACQVRLDEIALDNLRDGGEQAPWPMQYQSLLRLPKFLYHTKRQGLHSLEDWGRKINRDLLDFGGIDMFSAVEELPESLRSQHLAKNRYRHAMSDLISRMKNDEVYQQMEGSTRVAHLQHLRRGARPKITGPASIQPEPWMGQHKSANTATRYAEDWLEWTDSMSCYERACNWTAGMVHAWIMQTQIIGIEPFAMWALKVHCDGKTLLSFWEPGGGTGVLSFLVPASVAIEFRHQVRTFVRCLHMADDETINPTALQWNPTDGKTPDAASVEKAKAIVAAIQGPMVDPSAPWPQAFKDETLEKKGYAKEILAARECGMKVLDSSNRSGENSFKSTGEAWPESDTSTQARLKKLQIRRRELATGSNRGLHRRCVELGVSQEKIDEAYDGVSCDGKVRTTRTEMFIDLIVVHEARINQLNAAAGRMEKLAEDGAKIIAPTADEVEKKADDLRRKAEQTAQLEETKAAIIREISADYPDGVPANGMHVVEGLKNAKTQEEFSAALDAGTIWLTFGSHSAQSWLQVYSGFAQALLNLCSVLLEFCSRLLNCCPLLPSFCRDTSLFVFTARTAWGRHGHYKRAGDPQRCGEHIFRDSRAD